MRKMNRHGLLAKSMSFVLSFALVFTSVDLSTIGSFAAEQETKTEVSTEVESVEVTRTITVQVFVSAPIRTVENKQIVAPYGFIHTLVDLIGVFFI